MGEAAKREAFLKTYLQKEKSLNISLQLTSTTGAAVEKNNSTCEAAAAADHFDFKAAA